jgi:uncharacterized protein YabN with tetrapyrrole methylase and pyrophosphatase domain
MLEEAYEAVAAIDSGQPSALCEELGDVLLQVVLHAQIASENGDFTMDDVVKGLSAKLVRRHPHVFGEDMPAADLPAILRRWNEIKAEEKGRRQVAPLLPILVEARKLVDEQWRDGKDELEDIEALDEEGRAGMEILRAIRSSWCAGFDPELALRKAVKLLSEYARDSS